MRVLTNPKTQAEIFAFDSASEVTEYIDPRAFIAHDAAFVGEDLPEWSKVTERSLKDWQEGMELLGMYRDRLKAAELPELKNRKRITEWHETEGEEFDVERAMQGLPAWRRTRREKADGPATVTLVIDTTTPMYLDTTDIFWRGAAALALAELLEAKGYGTELWVVNGSRAFEMFYHPLLTAACLKRPGDPFDISTLTNAAAGWFYRTVTFSLIRSIGLKTSRAIQGSLGPCYTPVASDLNMLTTDECRVYSAGHYTFNGALGVVQAEIKRIGEAEETGKQPE